MNSLLSYKACSSGEKTVTAQLQTRGMAIIDGNPVTYNVKRKRMKQYVGEDTTEIKESTQVLSKRLAKDLMDYLDLICHGRGRIIWNNVRGTPYWKRRATVVIQGPPGTGKTLMQCILTRGLNKGYIDALNMNFSLSGCHNVDVIVWEEANLAFQFVDLYKKVFEGRDYVINMKGKSGSYQGNWTPVVVTTNQSSFPKNVGTTDKAAIRERCYIITLGSQWYKTVSDRELDAVDLDRVANYIDLQWNL